jgi:hypothetical protein
MESEQIQQILPSLTTQETQRLRSDYPSIEHLEAGNVAAWLVERQEQLLVRAKDERTGMNLAKLITLAGGAVGAICYATSPLAPIGAIVAGVGYIWAVAQDLNDSHQFAPVPFVRGNFFEFLSAMGDKEAREEWFQNSNELVDLMFHLNPFERYEFGMLKEHAHVLAEYLSKVESGKRFYAYRWLLDWFVNLRGSFPAQDQLTNHLATVTADPRVNYQQVSAIQEHQERMVAPQSLPETKFAELPPTKTVELPTPKFVDLPSPEVKLAEENSEAIDVVTQTNTVADEPINNDSPTTENPQPQSSHQHKESNSQRFIIPQTKQELISALKQQCPALLSLVKSHPIRAVGVQRSGKTTLVKKLALLRLVLLPNHKVIASTPHYEPENPYPNSFQVVGVKEGKRDYPAIRQEWHQLAARVEACQVNSITTVWDEFGLMNKVLSEEELISVLTSCLRETMKFGEYPIFIVHGETQAFLPGSKGLVTIFLNSTVRVETLGEKVEGKDGLETIRPTGKFRIQWLDGLQELGKIPEWLTEELLLSWLPSATAKKKPVEKEQNNSTPTEQQIWDRLIWEATEDQINTLIEQRRSHPIAKDSNPVSEVFDSLQTIDEQIAFAVEAIAEYLQDKKLEWDTPRNIYNGKNRLKKVAKTLNEFKDLLEVAAEMEKICYVNERTSTRVSLFANS